MTVMEGLVASWATMLVTYALYFFALVISVEPCACYIFCNFISFTKGNSKNFHSMGTQRTVLCACASIV